MQGKRVDDYTAPHMLNIGEYAKVPEAKEGYWWPGHPYWVVRHPDGGLGMLVTHTITEHEDGTITVSPSILAPTERDGKKWHGHLVRGVWKEC